MANSVDPDRTPRSVSTLFAEASLSENIGKIRCMNRKDKDQLTKPRNLIKVLATSIYYTIKKSFCKRTAVSRLDRANA